MEVDLSKVEAILDKQDLSPRSLIPTLLQIQGEFNYLPPEAIQQVSQRMNVPLIQVYQVASFYKAFSLEPRGKHIITVCLGTACHVRGAGRLIDQVANLLEVEPGQTTPDGQFTLEGVNCLGACALGPVMVVDGKYYGNMVASKVERILKKYSEKEEVPANG